MNNPFSIIFGKEPTNYINQIKEQNKIINDFESCPSPTPAYLLVGLRGTGKTVLTANIRRYFDNNENRIIVNANPKISIFENIANQIYEKVYSESSSNEQKILKAFESNESMKNIDLRIKAGFDEKSFSVYRDRLIKKGLLISTTYGKLEFALPRFYDFLKTAI